MTWVLDPDDAAVGSRSWFAPAGISHRRNVLFRARARLKHPGSRLRIAVEGAYRLWLEGEAIGSGPARGGRAWACVDSWRGEAPAGTWVAVEAWCGNMATFRDAPAAPALLVDGVAVDTWQVQVAEDWREDAPLWNAQQGHIAWRRLQHEPLGWQCGRDASTWTAPVPVAIAKQLTARGIVGLQHRVMTPVSVLVTAEVAATGGLTVADPGRQCAEEGHRPLRAGLVSGSLDDGGIVIAAGADGVVLQADLGVMCTAGVELDLEAPAGAVLDVAHGEHLADGRVRSHLRRGGMADYSFAHRNELRAGLQTVPVPPLSKGVRHVQLVLRGIQAGTRIRAIRGIDLRHPLPHPSTLATEDAGLDALWKAGVETIHACALDTLVDCPLREGALWVNDLLVEVPAWLHAGGDPQLTARCLRLALAHQRSDGLVPGVVPDNGPDGCVLSATCAFLPLVVEEQWQWTGDRALLVELLPGLLRQAEAVSTWATVPGQLTPPPSVWQFVDWSYVFGGPRELSGRSTAVLGWFHVLGLDALSRLCRAAGREQDADRCTTAADAHAGGLEVFWDPAAVCWREWLGADAPPAAELVPALALLSGRLDPLRSTACIDALASGSLLESDGYMQTQVLRALVAAGHVKAALGRLRRRWVPVAQCSSTLWEALVHEAGDRAFDRSGSLCHGFSAGPLGVLQGALLGLRPLAPGWGEACYEPAEYWNCSGSVTTPIGVWDVRRDGSLVVPDGARLRLADGRWLGPGHHQRAAIGCSAAG